MDGTILNRAKAQSLLWLLPLLCPLAAANGNVASPFLNLGVGARAQSMGTAYSAQVRDASAVYWNPSALVLMDGGELFLYSGRLRYDYSYNYVAYGRPFRSRRAAFGFSGAYLGKGTFEGRDESGQPTAEFSAYDRMATLAYARKPSLRAAWGFAASVLQSRIRSETAQGFAFDVAGTYRWTERTRFSFGLYHLGAKISYRSEAFHLPATVSSGLSHRVFDPLTFSAEARYGMHDRRTALAVGGQIDVTEAACFRLGYVSNLARLSPGPQPRGSWGGLSGLGMGVGVRIFARSSFDYAFVPLGELGNTHHLDVTWKFK